MLSGLLITAVLLGGPPVPVWDHFLERGQVMCDDQHSSLLMLLDLDADGADEILLAHSSHCGTGGCWWLVYTPTEKPGSLRYAGSVACGLVAFARAPRVLLGSWHMSASESAQTCWRLEQHELLRLSAEECNRVPWAPAHLTGEDSYRWIRAHEPLRFRAPGGCQVPASRHWIEVSGRHFGPQRIPNLAKMIVVNPEKR